MNTLADLKRRIQPGVVVNVTNHRYPNLNGERTVVRAQTQKFSMTIPAGHPKAGTESWMNYPKAKFIRFDGPDTVTFLNDEEWQAALGGATDFLTITF